MTRWVRGFTLPGRAMRTTGGVLIGRVASQAGSMLTVLITARQLGASGRGAIVLVVTLVTFASIICTLGLPLAGRLRLPATDHPLPLADYLGLGLLLGLVEGAVAALTAAVFLPVVGVPADAALLVVIGTFAVLHGTSYLLVSALMAYGRLVTASASDASGLILQGALCLAGAAMGLSSVTGFIALLAAGLLLPVALVLGSLSRLGHSVLPSANVVHWGQLLRTGLPSIATMLSEGATFRVDRLILGVFASPGVVGVYSVAATAAEVLRFLPTSVSQLVFYETARGALRTEQLRRARRATLLGVVMAGGCIALAAPIAVPAIFGEEFRASVTPLRVLLLAELAAAVYILSSNVLSASGRVSLAARAATFGVLIVVAADMALIPPFAAAGAAWASVISYSAMALVAERYGRRHPATLQESRPS